MMEDVSLHSPVVRSTGPPGPSEMGQFTYEDEEGAYTPRRIWPVDYARPQRYWARPASPQDTPAPPTQRHTTISHTALALLTTVGLAIFTCSTASLVIVALLMDSTREEVNTAGKQIAGVQGTLDKALAGLDQNQKQLASLLSLMDLWLGVVGVVNSTLPSNGTGAWY